MIQPHRRLVQIVSSVALMCQASLPTDDGNFKGLFRQRLVFEYDLLRTDNVAQRKPQEVSELHHAACMVQHDAGGNRIVGYIADG